MGAALLPAISGCEDVLGLGDLTERGAASGLSVDSAANDMADSADEPPGPDASSFESDDAQEASGQGAAAGDAPNGLTATADAAGIPDVGAPADVLAAPPSAEGGAEAGTVDAQASAGADSSAPKADAAAEPDAGAPPGCAAGATIIVMPAIDHSVAFGTLGAVCVTYKGTYVNGWNASNVQGRSVTVTGSTTTALATVPEGDNQAGLTAGPNGMITWSFTAGRFAYAAMFAF